MRKRTAVLVAASGVVLAGCGGDDDSDNGVADLEVGEIMSDVQEAVTATESARLIGEVTDDGQELTVDMRYGPENAEGSIASEGLEVELLTVDGDVYMKAAPETWDSIGGEGLGELIGDSYVLAPPDDPSLSDVTQVLDREAFIGEIFSGVEDADTDGTTKGEQSEIDGQPVVALNGEDGAVMYVATTGEPLPVRLTAPEGESGSLEFEWDIETDISAPDEADVVDMSELAS